MLVHFEIFTPWEDGEECIRRVLVRRRFESWAAVQTVLPQLLAMVNPDGVGEISIRFEREAGDRGLLHGSDH